MSKVILGKTGIVSDKNAFGALPIQRVSKEEAVRLLRKARDGGFTFFDTARFYTDSEEKLGLAFGGNWDGITVASKTQSLTPEDFRKDLETSLSLLKKDCIDIYQFHNPPFCPKPGDGTGLYECMLKAKEMGKIRFIGITNHRLDIAHDAIDSGLYDTLQFPFSYLSGEKEEELVKKCKESNMGFIAMKALSGGLITNSLAAYQHANMYENVLPIWGIQKENELDEFISYIKNPPGASKEILEFIEKDKKQLTGDFCRGCGYCMPCPMGIEINTCARASLMIRRAPVTILLSREGEEKMRKIESCIECGECMKKCPYSLNTPELLKRNYQDYLEILAGKPL
ncbi:MAG: aldo/keto reductase [Clostridia bacterium]|nr:aldo/keto reductase [Clostridia bacterium]